MQTACARDYPSPRRRPCFSACGPQRGRVNGARPGVRNASVSSPRLASRLRQRRGTSARTRSRCFSHASVLEKGWCAGSGRGRAAPDAERGRCPWPVCRPRGCVSQTWRATTVRFCVTESPGLRSHHTGKKNIRAPGTNALLKRTRDSSPSPACLHGAVARERKSGGRRPRHHLRGAPRPAHWVQEGVNGHLGKVSHFQKPQLSFYGFHNKF